MAGPSSTLSKLTNKYDKICPVVLYFNYHPQKLLAACDKCVSFKKKLEKRWHKLQISIQNIMRSRVTKSHFINIFFICLGC